MNSAFVKQHGASIVHWLFLLIPMAGAAIIALDFNGVYVSQAELQNAADAAALEGARNLYDPDGTLNADVFCGDSSCNSCNSDADPACKLAKLNRAATYAASDPIPPVEVVSVKPGHWTFLADWQDSKGIERGGVFSAYDGPTAPVINPATKDFRDIFDSTIARTDQPTCPPGDEDYFVTDAPTDINSDPCVVNAVEVVVERNSQRIRALLGTLFGLSDWEARARAVGYVDFAGSIRADELDAPIALCEHLIRDESTGKFDCSIGRLSTSSSNDEGAAKWTDLSTACQGTSTSTVQAKIAQMPCAGGTGLTHVELTDQDSIGVIGTGSATPNVDSMQTCFSNADSTPIPALVPKDGNYGPSGGQVNLDAGALDSTLPFPDQPLELKLPVVDCDDAENAACQPIFAAVTVQMVWANSNTATDNRIPTAMRDVEGYDSDWDVSTGTETDRYGQAIPAPNGVNQAPPPPTVHGAGPFVGEDYPYYARVWDSFVKHFGIKYVDHDADGNEVMKDAWYNIDDPQIKTGYRSSTFYFSPNCEPTILGGVGGNVPFQLAAKPVLVN